MQAQYILVIEDAENRQIINLEDVTHSIGRHSSNSIVIDSNKISRKHAHLMRKFDQETQEYSYWVLDGDLQGNKSYNGIYLNGKRIFCKQLKDGDVINFGCKISAVYHKINYYQIYANDKNILEDIHKKTTLLIDRDNSEEKDHYDDLSERKTFYENLCESLDKAKENSQQMAILLINLENLKQIINDISDKNLSEKILAELAKILNTCFRSGDIVTRWKWDQFAVLLPKIRHTKNIEQITQRIFQNLEQPLILEENYITFKIELGSAIYPQDGTDIKSLLQAAKTNLDNQPKKLNISHTSPPSKPIIAGSKLAKVEYFLHQALEKQQFSLYYQPQLNLSTGKIEGLEALIRWQHPQKGLILPNRFISLAEQTNMIVPIGEWVLKTACQQAQIWQKELGVSSLSIAVNLSAQQFQDPELVDKIRKILETTGIAPDILELEITERTIRENEQLAHQSFSDLQKLGVRLSLDDFGTGYASLNYLQEFTFQTLKIAQSYVGELTDKPQDMALLSAIMAWSRLTRLNIVAEGVETQEQLELLRRLNCDKIQGYQISPPLEAEAATQFLALHFSQVA